MDKIFNEPEIAAFIGHYTMEDWGQVLRTLAIYAIRTIRSSYPRDLHPSLAELSELCESAANSKKPVADPSKSLLIEQLETIYEQFHRLDKKMRRIVRPDARHHHTSKETAAAPTRCDPRASYPAGTVGIPSLFHRIRIAREGDFRTPKNNEVPGVMERAIRSESHPVLCPAQPTAVCVPVGYAGRPKSELDDYVHRRPGTEQPSFVAAAVAVAAARDDDRKRYYGSLVRPGRNKENFTASVVSSRDKDVFHYESRCGTAQHGQNRAKELAPRPQNNDVVEIASDLVNSAIISKFAGEPGAGSRREERPGSSNERYESWLTASHPPPADLPSSCTAAATGKQPIRREAVLSYDNMTAPAVTTETGAREGTGSFGNNDTVAERPKERAFNRFSALLANYGSGQQPAKDVLNAGISRGQF